jgi:hypothetical protein
MFTICSGRDCFRAGGCVRWPRVRACTTPSAITWVPCGRLTIPSSPGVCAGTTLNEEAARIAIGIIEAAKHFKGRLPETFGGYDRELTGYPVQYPTACSSQAWSSGATLLFIRTMLGMEPQGLVAMPRSVS